MSDSMQGRPAGLYRRLDGTAQTWTGADWAPHWDDPALAIGDEPRAAPRAAPNSEIATMPAGAPAPSATTAQEPPASAPTTYAAPEPKPFAEPEPAFQGSQRIDDVLAAPATAVVPRAPVTPVRTAAPRQTVTYTTRNSSVRPIGTRRRAETVWTGVAAFLALLGCGEYTAAIGTGFFLQIVSIIVLVYVVRRRALQWLWVIVPVEVLRGPLGIGAVTYAAQGVSTTFGVLTVLTLLFMLFAGGRPRLRR